MTRAGESRVGMSVGRVALGLGLLLVLATSIVVVTVVTPPKAAAAAVATGWTTYHHDNTRDGYDPNAPSFSGGPFSNWDKTLDCQVYAEPLALSGVVYAATMCNSIYAYTVGTGALLWSRTNIATQSTGGHCSWSGNAGIMGTPVIDPAAGVIYAVMTEPTKYQMIALHISDGTTVTGFPVTLSVVPNTQEERAALSLANGHVYVPFGGWIGDCGTYHPEIVSVNLSGTPAQDHDFQPQSGCQNGSGLWAGSGLAIDGAGSIYAATGNSTDDATCMGGSTSYNCSNNSHWDYGDGMLKLDPTLVLKHQWAPDNPTQSWCALNAADTDIGSVGPILLPNNQVFQTGKSGYGWLLDEGTLGGFNGQLFQGHIGTCSPDAVFAGVAYYAGRVYVPCDGVGLVAFSVNLTNHTFSTTPDWVQNVDPGPPIAAMGLIWVRDQGGSNLYGFDPVTGTQRVQAALGGGSNHFATPAEDGGWVFAGHGTHIRAFNFNIPPCNSTTSTSWFASCSDQSYTLTGSNGSTWTDMDTSTPLSVTFTPSVDSYAVLTANTSLFTSRRGYNQDIGIAVTGGAYPSATGQPEAWKESGGAATLAPNAAFLQTVIPVLAATQYTARLQWKSNVADPYSIWAGAGPIPGKGFSPTRITAMLIPQSAGTVVGVTSTQHYTLTGSNGATWNDMDATNLSVNITPPAGNWIAYFGGNADLWTDQAGYDQDIGVAVTGGVYPTNGGQPEIWKESGGGGTFAPNAAFAQVPLAVAGGVSYTAKLQWKANRADAGTIEAGAGPVNGKYSPTSLYIVLVPSPGNAFAKSSTQTYTNTSSDGSTWTVIDATNLEVTVPPGSTANFLLSGNVDLFTRTAGYNQDIGVMISGGTFGSGTVVAWEESGGGFAFSPDATFVEVDVTLPSSTLYVVSLVWKSNRDAPGVTLEAGAGPVAGAYSPTWVMAQRLP